MIQHSATRCSCIAILLSQSSVSSALTLCVASQQVFIVVSAEGKKNKVVPVLKHHAMKTYWGVEV
jgi:hypothetical protein